MLEHLGELNFMKRPKQSRAYVCKVKNSKSRTSASKEYFQVYVEGDRSYLFTTNDLDKAEIRARKNPEDVIAINFVEPKQPEPVVEVVEKIIEVPAKGLIAKVFSGIFG